jgi:hypothetical protein
MQEGRSTGRWLALVFVVFALVDLAWWIANARFDANPSLVDIATYGLQIVPSVAGVLFPAALLVRHPDAAARARILLAGTVLFALGQALLILSTPFEAFFESVTPPSVDQPGLVPLAAVYNGLISVVFAVALLAMAAGLTRARFYEDRSGPLTMLFVPLMTIFGTVFGVLTAASGNLDSVTLSPGLAIYIGSSVFFGVLRIVVWSYLLVALWRGLRAGEDPRRGWFLGMLGAAFVILTLVLLNLGGLLDPQNPDFNTIFGYITVISYGIGHVLLLVAFVARLPALDAEEDEPEEEPEEEPEVVVQSARSAKSTQLGRAARPYRRR